MSAVDEITESLGAGEPVGLSLLPDFVRCERTGTDVFLEADCTARFRIPGCVASASARFTIERDAEAIAGNGQWQVTTAGDCGPGTGNGGEAIDIAATRIGGERRAGTNSRPACSRRSRQRRRSPASSRGRRAMTGPMRRRRSSTASADGGES